MSNFWFPDNTVLCNFAGVLRLDLLREILRGRGRWSQAIADEAEASSVYHPTLASVASDNWLGEPIDVAGEFAAEVELMRRVSLGGSVLKPTQHLGEAQTCWIILNQAEFNGSLWVTDDRDAADYAKFKGITTRDTAGLISEGIQDDCCSQDEGFKLLQEMLQQGRSLRVPAYASDL